MWPDRDFAVTLASMRWAANFSLWQKAALFGAALFSLVLVGLVAREIFFAANPDKRPKRRKRRRSKH
jgi:hypothetical protein